MQTTPPLLTRLGLDTLPKEDQDELNAELGEVIFMGVMRRVWDTLDFHQQDALMALLRESELNPESDEKRAALASFLDTQVPDFPKYVQVEVEAILAAQREARADLPL
jgi:Fe-S cluster biosynthesis and repair protein YggX